jgi:hypothetical protein
MKYGVYSTCKETSKFPATADEGERRYSTCAEGDTVYGYGLGFLSRDERYPYDLSAFGYTSLSNSDAYTCKISGDRTSKWTKVHDWIGESGWRCDAVKPSPN